MTRKKSVAAGEDKVAPVVLVLPAPAISMEADGSRVPLTSKKDIPVVESRSNSAASSVAKPAIAAPSPRVFSNNPAVLEAMKRRSARLNSDLISAISDTQPLFSPVVAATTESSGLANTVEKAPVQAAAPVTQVSSPAEVSDHLVGEIPASPSDQFLSRWGLK